MVNKNQINSLLKLVVFAIGGLLGALINWALTYALTEYLAVYYVYSNVIGSSVNSVFNFLYHRSITFRVSSSTGHRFVRFAIVNVFVVALNVLVMYALTEVFHIWYLFSAFLATCVIVTLNFLLNQSLVFFEMGRIDYRGIRGDYYDGRMRSRNPALARLHAASAAALRGLAGKYGAGGAAVELGYGNCSGTWNAGGLPVIGVDVNDRILAHAKACGRLREGIRGDIGQAGLKDGSAALVIIAEVLARVDDPGKVLGEAYRILAPGGTLVVRAPYAKGISLWKPLFYAQCLLEGYILGDELYRNRCGYVRGFSPRTLGEALGTAGFTVIEEAGIWRSTILMAARKTEARKDYSDVTIIVPTLNERENIAKLLDALEGLYPGVSAIVADDGSADGTREIVSRRHGENARIVLLDRSGLPHGLTASVMDAIAVAGTPFFVVIDADFQHPPDKVREIVRLLDGYDLVVGTREKVENWGAFRRLMSLVATLSGKLSLYARHSACCTDIMSGFFGGRTGVVRPYIERSPSAFEPGGYKILFDLLKLMPASTRIGEVPYTFLDRSEGRSKISTKHIVIYFKSLFR